MASFKFNGVKKDYLYILMGFNRPAFAPIEREIIKVNGLAGGHLIRTNTDVRRIEVPVILRASNQADMQKQKEDLAKWLITEDPKELIFDDELDRTYLAVLDGSADLDELVFRGKGKLTFVCTMPYKLGATKNQLFAVAGQDFKANFTNNGSEKSPPLITIQSNAQSPSLDVIFGDDYFRLGYPTGIKTKTVNQENLLIEDKANSLASWTKFTGKIGDYTGTGDMQVLNNKFQPKLFGDGTGWHGAIYTRDIPVSPLTDFKADMRLKLFSSYMNQVGKVVLMFLAQDGSVVAELNMNDDYASHNMNKATAVIGGSKTIVNTTGFYDTTFNDFRGHYAIARRGKEWSVYFAKADGVNGVDGTSLVERWNDSNNESLATAKQVTKIAIAFLQYGALSTPMDMWIEGLKVWKLNTLQVDETPYIINVGDTIQIDTEHSLVTINGENAIKIKDIFSRFPVIKEGVNNIIIRPSNIGTASLTYRERYK